MQWTSYSSIMEPQDIIVDHLINISTRVHVYAYKVKLHVHITKAD